MSEFCKALVSGSGTYGAFNRHRCSRKATIGEYCKIHDPATMQAKQDASYAKWKAEFAEKEKVRLVERAAPQLFKALENMLHIFDRGLTEPMIGRKVCDEAIQAIALAKGDQP